MKYKITNNIEEATHWIAKEDENNEFSNVTVGNLYLLLWDEKEYGHHIVDDEGIFSLIFLVHNGDYVCLN